jgi:hypothetical protein
MDPKIYYSVHKSLPLVSIPIDMNTFYTLTSYVSKFHFNIILPWEYLVIQQTEPAQLTL